VGTLIMFGCLSSSPSLAYLMQKVPLSQA